MKKRVYAVVIGAVISTNVNAAEGWSNFYLISAIDSLSMGATRAPALAVGVKVFNYWLTKHVNLIAGADNQRL